MSFSPVTRLTVELDFASVVLPVGQLIKQNHAIWFQYDERFLATNFFISPFHLPLASGLHGPKDRLFEGLLGVFNDSLPDGWGRLLLDRQVQSLGILPQQLGPLDRLAYVGQHGMGALRYYPAMGIDQASTHQLNLDQLAQQAQQILVGSAEVFFTELLNLSGASCGARPKIIAAVSADKQTVSATMPSSTTALDYAEWLIKFPATNDLLEMAQIEYAYSLMAKAAGVVMPETYLFTTPTAAYFATKCFDRSNNSRYHMHTLSGMLHADHRAPSIDYEQALRCTQVLTKDSVQLSKHFRLAVFNVLAHNRDDHAKNFAYLMDSAGIWQFAPAYDLTFSYGPGGEQSMSVMGEGRKPTTKHLFQLADKLHIDQAAAIIDEVSGTIQQWPKFADQASLSRKTTQLIQSHLSTA